MTTIRIMHFSDTLCIWAYLAQVRMDELQAAFGDQVEIEYRLLPVFGSARHKIDSAWGEEDGRRAYCQHIQRVAEGFDHVAVHPAVWNEVAPHSSLPSHLYLCAVRLLERDGKLAEGAFVDMAWRIRKAFFADLQDISTVTVLCDLVEQAGIPVGQVQDRLDSGEAHAEMAEDMKLARDQLIKASPTLLFNEDRQRLTGNVGYRIIEANVRELINRPVGEQSWC